MLARRILRVISISGFIKTVLWPRIAWNGERKNPCHGHKNVTRTSVRVTLAGSQQECIQEATHNGFKQQEDIEFTLEVKLASEDTVAAHPGPRPILLDRQCAATYCDDQWYRY